MSKALETVQAQKDRIQALRHENSDLRKAVKEAQTQKGTIRALSGMNECLRERLGDFQDQSSSQGFCQSRPRQRLPILTPDSCTGGRDMGRQTAERGAISHGAPQLLLGSFRSAGQQLFDIGNNLPRRTLCDFDSARFHFLGQFANEVDG